MYNTCMTLSIDYLWWAECPSHEEGLALLRDVIAAEGIDAVIRLVEVCDEADAQRLHFIGSPTILVNGQDIDPHPVASGAASIYALTCRAYRRDDGRIAPLPTREWLRRRLSALSTS